VWTAAWAVCLGAALLAGSALAAPTTRPARGKPTTRPARKRRPSRKYAPLVKIGQEAPEVEILKLRLEKNDKGVIVGKISGDKVKFSAFEGKQIVCIFSSSYT